MQKPFPYYYQSQKEDRHGQGRTENGRRGDSVQGLPDDLGGVVDNRQAHAGRKNLPNLIELDEDVVGEAVGAANAIIEKEVDPLRKFGADSTLQTAATFLATSILCQIAAVYDLVQTSLGKARGDNWLALAEGYRRDYERLIADFHPPSNRLSGPKRT